MEEEEQMKVYTPKDVYNYARIGDIDNLKVALDYGTNSIEWYRNKHGNTALHAATYYGHSDCINVLISARL